MPLHQAIERDRIVSLIALLKEAQKKYEDTERVSQLAVYKLSALQESVAEENKQRILAPLGGDGAFLRRHQADEGPRQRVRPAATGAEERAVGREVARRGQGGALQRLLRESLGAGEPESGVRDRIEQAVPPGSLALEGDRRGDRRRSLQHPTGDEARALARPDRASRFLPASTGSAVTSTELRAPPPSHDESDLSFAALDEVLVRMRLKQLRSRRLEALKRVSLTRHSKLEQASEDLFCHRQIQTTNSRILKLNAVLHMHRVVSHVRLRKKRSFLNGWKVQTRLLHIHSVGTVPASGEDPSGESIEPSARSSSSSAPTSAEAVAAAENQVADEQPLQEEIKKLQKQLASSKSEVWQYKRQLLKQFLAQ